MAFAPKGVVEMEPVRQFTGDHHRLAITLLQELERTRVAMAETLVKNNAKDFADYRHICGRIEGLDIAIAHCKAIQSKM